MGNMNKQRKRKKEKGPVMKTKAQKKDFER